MFVGPGRGGDGVDGLREYTEAGDIRCIRGEGSGGLGENESRARSINHTFVGITLVYRTALARSKGSPPCPLSPPPPRPGRVILDLPLCSSRTRAYTRARSRQTRELRKGTSALYSPGDYDILRLEWLDTSSRGRADGSQARTHART